MDLEQPSSKNVLRHPSQPNDKRWSLRKTLLLVLVFVLVVVGLLAWWSRLDDSSLVPDKIRKSLDFSVYYPEHLPAGYTLSTTSFRLAEPGVVLFSVTYAKGKSIVFSEEQQPSSGDIDKFISSYIPLNSAVELPLGQAKVGAYGTAPTIRTVLSLPIHDGPWLIMTAPADVSHDDLVNIAKSLTK